MDFMDQSLGIVFGEGSTVAGTFNKDGCIMVVRTGHPHGEVFGSGATMEEAMRDAAEKMSSRYKTCTCCGTVYSRREWYKLRFVGSKDYSDLGMGVHEYRHCLCGTTLTVRKGGADG